eukprot:scaffold51359_cov53-Attheya_sp.AAC.1
MASSATEVMALRASVTELKELVERLEARQSSEGLYVADESFASYLDTEAWVALNLPGFRYGFFVDGHTLLENLMSADYVDYSTTIDEAHKVSRSNFTSGTSTAALPGVASYKEWSTGGTGGTRGDLRQFYTQKLKESKKQLMSAITTRLSSGPAQCVVIALLEESYEFCMGLSHFMDTFMQDLTKHGHPQKEAWLLTSECVLRMYGDISDARIYGRGARDGSDDVQTAASCLWATLSTHRVMREYLRLDFDRHPSVSSALTRYQTKHSSQDAINKFLDRRVALVESKAAGIQGKVDAMGQRVPDITIPDLPPPQPPLSATVSVPSKSPMVWETQGSLSTLRQTMPAIIIASAWPAWLGIERGLGLDIQTVFLRSLRWRNDLRKLYPTISFQSLDVLEMKDSSLMGSARIWCIPKCNPFLSTLHSGNIATDKTCGGWGRHIRSSCTWSLGSGIMVQASLAPFRDTKTFTHYVSNCVTYSSQGRSPSSTLARDRASPSQDYLTSIVPLLWSFTSLPGQREMPSFVRIYMDKVCESLIDITR